MPWRPGDRPCWTPAAVPGGLPPALARMGHRAIGVDKDAGLIDIARKRYPGVPYLACDLLLLTAEEAAGGRRTQRRSTSSRCPATSWSTWHRAASGRCWATWPVCSDRRAGSWPGSRTDRDYTPQAFRSDAAGDRVDCGTHLATWHLDPVTEDSDWASSCSAGPGPFKTRARRDAVESGHQLAARVGGEGRRRNRGPRAHLD